MLDPRADGAGVAEPLGDGLNGIPYSFSPDGKRLAFSQSQSLMILALDLSDPEHPRAAKPETFLQRPSVTQPAFSPDGLWIAYTSGESGGRDVFVRPFRPGGPSNPGRYQISTGGGQYPVWSRDGKQLLYETLDNHVMVAAYSVQGDSFVPAKPEPWSKAPLFRMGWDPNLDIAADGKRLLVTMQTEPANGAPHVTFLLNFFDEVRRRIPPGK